MDYAVLRNQIATTRPDIDLTAVDAAHAFAETAHEGQTRYSGEPYIVHPVAATSILLRLNPDLAAIQACLLHDVTEDTEANHEDLQNAFGDEVADLVQGCEKLALVKVQSPTKADQWKHLFLAMAKDIRIVFIKLSDRLHNMQTLDHVPEEKRWRIAHESMEVHAAIASRLGIYQIKSEMEDLCFQYLYPEEYEALSKKMREYQARSADCMEFATSQVEQLLFREGIEVERVSGRLKHLWSIHQKMNKKAVQELESIHDLFAVRVVLPDLVKDEQEQVSHLYATLGVLHNEYLPIQDRFKDYVAVPKPNGYRSLHTTVLGVGADVYEEPTEIQIRTQSMHHEAEIGIASHWRYKQVKGVDPKLNRQRHVNLHQALSKVYAVVQAFPELEGPVREWVERYQHVNSEDKQAIEASLREKGISDEDFEHIRKGRSQEHLSLKPNVDEQLAWLRGLGEDEGEVSELDLYPDKIFVLTPDREVRELPRGATPIDFAYLIHTELGHRMVHAKVNGRIVPLEHELRNGDIVEVGTKKDAHPREYWLSVVKTSSARAKIKNWFNKQDAEQNIAKGRAALNELLRQNKQPELDEKWTLLKEYGGQSRTVQEREQIIESIGLGSVTVNHVFKTLFPEQAAEEKKKPTEDKSSENVEELTSRVLITGEDDLPVVLSACCKPRPPMPIIAYVTRGSSIRVHRQNCQELAGLEGQRFVSAHWKSKPNS